MDTTSSDSATPDVSGGEKCRLVIVGATAKALVSGPDGFGNYAEIVRAYNDLEDWRTNAVPTSADLLVVHCPALFPDTLEWVHQRIEVTGATRAIVLYDFAQEGTVQSIEEPGSHITALRAPVSPGELKEACEADLALATMRQQWTDDHLATETSTAPAVVPEPGEIPPRQFSDDQLARLSQISTAVDCECPHHLSSLLVSLNAFEEYSRKCENRNDEDAVLHAYLHGSTARARVIMEDALSVLSEAEGFDLG